MRAIDFNRTEDQWGLKLEFTVEGDVDEFERQIDDCDWENKTHHQRLSNRRWRIDRSSDSIDEINRETGLNIPLSQLWDDIDEKILFEIKRDSLWIEPISAPEGLVSFLEDEFSYEVEYYDQNTHTHRTYEKSVVEQGKIPIGLRTDLEDFLDDLDVECAIADYRPDPIDYRIDYEWNFPYDLRDYQRRGLMRMIRGSSILQIPTGGGKTILALKFIHHMGLPALILVHRKELLRQWRDEIRSTLGVEPGVIQGSTEDWRDVTVAMIPSLSNKIENDPSMIIDDYPILITDEVHHLSSDSWWSVAMKTKSHYRYGLSATVTEDLRTGEDGMKIIAGTGPNDFVVRPEDLIERGFLAEPQFEWLYPPRYDERPDNWQEAYRQGIVQNEGRNRMIAQRTQEMIDEGRRILVTVDRIDHGDRLIRRINDGIEFVDWDGEEYIEIDDLPDPSMCETPIPIAHRDGQCVSFSSTGDQTTMIRKAIDQSKTMAAWVSGSDDEETRDLLLDSLARGDINCLVSTLLDEGIDIPTIDTIVLAGGGKSPTNVIQTVGRSLRPEGSDTARIIDCKDMGSYIEDHARSRYETMNNYYGQFCSTKPKGY